LSSPLTKLTRKGAKFEYNKACEQCFQELKQRLTTTPVLAIPRRGKKFTLYSDAFYLGLGCVLMQDGSVITYEF